MGLDLSGFEAFTLQHRTRFSFNKHALRTFYGISRSCWLKNLTFSSNHRENAKRKWFQKNDMLFERQHGVMRGREFMSLLSHTSHFVSPGSFPQLTDEGVETNSSLSDLTRCVLWWPGPKSEFLLLARGAAIASPALSASAPIFPVGILDYFLPSS